MKKIILQIIGGITALWIAILIFPGIEMNIEEIQQMLLITGIIGVSIFIIRMLVEIIIFPIKFIVVNTLIFILVFLGLRIITNFFPALVIGENSYIWLAGVITGINILTHTIFSKS